MKRKKVESNTMEKKSEELLLIRSIFKPVINFGQFFGLIINIEERGKNKFKFVLLIINRFINLIIVTFGFVVYAHACFTDPHNFGLDSGTFLKLHVLNFHLCTYIFNIAFFNTNKRIVNFMEIVHQYHPYLTIALKPKQINRLNCSTVITNCVSSFVAPGLVLLIAYGYIQIPINISYNNKLKWVCSLSCIYNTASLGFFYHLYGVCIFIVHDCLKIYNEKLTKFCKDAIDGKFSVDNYFASVTDYHKKYQYVLFIMDSFKNVLSFLCAVMFVFSTYILCIMLFLITKVYQDSSLLETSIFLTVWMIAIQISFIVIILLAISLHKEVTTVVKYFFYVQLLLHANLGSKNVSHFAEHGSIIG